MEKPHLVAVYGSLLSGLGNHRVMQRLGEEHYELVGETTIPGFNLFPLGGFPGIERGENSVKVEVYNVSNELLKGPLDRLEGYEEGSSDNDFYDRQLVKTEFGDAWIYIYVRGAGQRAIIQDGDWRNFINK